MRSLIVTLTLALGAFVLPAQAHAQAVPDGAATNPPPSSPAPQAPSSSPSQAVVAQRRRVDTVEEFVLYRGAFDSETRQPLFSHTDRGLVQFKRYAHMHDEPGGTFSVGVRVCTYPLSAEGKRQAMGSTCNESEVS